MRRAGGERIRDEIAASKAKGMWMGGRPPLGYEVKDRKLEIVEAEAETVRDIFRRYVDLGSVLELRDEPAAAGIVAKRHVSVAGGGHFGRGALYHLLQNRLYRGEISHKGMIHPGQNQAIVGQGLWDQVQARLGFLAPDISSAILDGRQPIELSAKRMSVTVDLAKDWSKQRRELGFG